MEDVLFLLLTERFKSTEPLCKITISLTLNKGRLSHLSVNEEKDEQFKISLSVYELLSFIYTIFAIFMGMN